jgi:hypothetical protein
VENCDCRADGQISRLAEWAFLWPDTQRTNYEHCLDFTSAFQGENP